MGPSMDAESQGGALLLDDGSGVLSEAEPFGWKIGLKPGGPKHQMEQERQRQQRQLQHLRHQRKQQQHLQRGIEKLMHNAHYRQMYEKYKGTQQKYKNELERILCEDCEIAPQDRKWKTSQQIDKEIAEAKMKKEEEDAKR